jgi:hypothetical protein
MSDNGSSNGPITLTPKRKWPNGMMKLPADTDDIDDFIQQKTVQYEEYNFTGSDLPQYYGEDFHNLEVETFNQADPAIVSVGK